MTSPVRLWASLQELLFCLSLFLKDRFLCASDNERLLALAGTANICFTVLFGLEALFKSVAVGFVLGKGTYLRSKGNLFDFALLIGSIASLTGGTAASSGGLGIIRGLRSFRVVRPLAAISHSRRLKRISQTVIGAVPGFLQVLLIVAVIVATFAILGVHIFAGKIGECVLPVVPGPNGTEGGNSSAVRLSGGHEACITQGGVWTP